MNIVDQREQLATAIRAVVSPDRAAVYPQAIDGPATFPAVVLGMPSWKPGPTWCLDVVEFPVAVIVARPGVSDAGTIDQLDQLWPVVLEALRSLSETSGLSVTRAEFGGFPIQGTTYPAQIIFCSTTT